MPPRGRRGSVQVQADDIQKAFQLFDLNSDGEITVREFVKIMTRKGDNCKPMDEADAIQLFQDFLLDADKNNDGKVNLAELSQAWGTGSAAAAVAAVEDIGGTDFLTILTEDAMKKMVTLWAPAEQGLLRKEPPQAYYAKLLKSDYSITWHILGEAEGPELVDSETHIAFDKETVGDDELTLEAYQAKVQPRLAAANYYQTRTTPLGYEGDMLLLQYDRYNRDGKCFEGGFLLGATVDERFVELWQWPRDVSKSESEAGGPKGLLAPSKRGFDYFLGFTWLNGWVL